MNKIINLALVNPAEKDSLSEEAEQYAAKLKEAGVDIIYKQFKGVPYGNLVI
ncbi:alpha/beta hydrolase [Bacillus zhangzhouensis]|nr:alpha/beta hydrolase [Bacillus zhangzhouensis]